MNRPLFFFITNELFKSSFKENETFLVPASQIFAAVLCCISVSVRQNMLFVDDSLDSGKL